MLSTKKNTLTKNKNKQQKEREVKVIYQEAAMKTFLQFKKTFEALGKASQLKYK